VLSPHDALAIIQSHRLENIMNFRKRGFRAMVLGLLVAGGLALTPAAFAGGSHVSVGVALPGVSIGYGGHGGYVGVYAPAYPAYYAPAYYPTAYYDYGPAYYSGYYYPYPAYYGAAYYYSGGHRHYYHNHNYPSHYSTHSTYYRH
jgi:hypothetical protein